MIWGSGGSKSRLAKAAGAEPAGQMRDEKVHAVVARSTFRSQNVQNTPASDHFWKLRFRKSARRCLRCSDHFFRLYHYSWVGSVSNKHNPSAKSGLDACVSSRITNVAN